MKDSREGEQASQAHPRDKGGVKALSSKDLTCNEAQVEELLSKAESTEGEDDEAGQAEKPAERYHPTSSPLAQE